MMFEIVLFWLVASVLVGIVASARGRSGFGYFLMSMLLSPLLTIVFVMCMPRLESTEKQSE